MRIPSPMKFTIFPAMVGMILSSGTTYGADAVKLDSVSPITQRVHELITLRGAGFGASQGTSEILFVSGGTTVTAGKAYVWRDNLIKIRVPVGDRIGAVNVSVPKTPLLVSVKIAGGEKSNTKPFQVITETGSPLSFRQLTQITANADVSTILGSPNYNIARTKDAEIGDANGDGFPDILDNNSNNIRNDTHNILRLNDEGRRFRTVRLEPRQPGDPGVFATAVPPGGDYIENGVTYDSDFVDIDLDGLPDIIQTASDRASMPPVHRLRILMNNAGGVPGRFTEDSAARLPAVTRKLDACPDDADHGDVNNDGNIDFLVSLRTIVGNCKAITATSKTSVFLNSGAGAFIGPVDISAPPNVSTHDAFFIDANADGFEDIILVNESVGAQAQLYLNDGNPAIPGFVLSQSFGIRSAAGDPADFNGDGFLDFVLARSDAVVFLNDPDNPGNFTPSTLPDSVLPSGVYYDIDMGDVDLDGDVDIVAAVITRSADDTIRIWLNNGNGTFVNATSPGAGAALPGIGGYERLSADLIDFDLDGDLDLYIAGADTQDVGPSSPSNAFGRVPNQFFENLTARPLPFEYAAKIVCGTQEDPKNTRLSRGFYATAINILNPNKGRATFKKTLSLTFPPDAQRAGDVFPIATDTLGSHEALEVDCLDLRRKLFPKGFPARYIKGFVVLRSSRSLDVSAVYTSRGLASKKRHCKSHGGGWSCAAKDDKHCGQAKNKACAKREPPCCNDKENSHVSIDVERVLERRVK